MSNKYHFYVTDMAPNGTRDLIITDDCSQVIESINEAVFGNIATCDVPNGAAVVCDGESVFITDQEGLIDDVRSGDCFSFGEVFEALYTYQLLASIAVSPVNDGSETLATLKKYIA